MKTTDEIRQCRKLIIHQIGLDGGMAYWYKQGKPFASVIWSNVGGWEHVSVAPFKKSILPSWDDMCELKSIFFRPDECVVQYHPPVTEYVNNVPNCLHLWRPLNVEMPAPPSIMVGIKDGMTAGDVSAAIRELTEYVNRETKI